MNKIGTILLGVFLTVMLVAVNVNAATSAEGGSVGFDPVGKMCWTMDDFTDTWVWEIEIQGNAVQISGLDPVYPAAMNGGGAIDGEVVLLTVEESSPDYGGIHGIHGVHSIILNLDDFTGIDYLSWFDINGNLVASYADGVTFSPCACPAPGAEFTGPTSAGK